MGFLVVRDENIASKEFSDIMSIHSSHKVFPVISYIFRTKSIPKRLRNDFLNAFVTFLAFETVSGPKFGPFS